MASRVQAGDGCITIDIVGDPDIESGQPLVVFMHGDGGASKRGKYFGSYVDQFRMLTERKINVLAIARPAYRLLNGPTTGIRMRFNKDPYTLPVIDGLAAALKALNAHYRPSRLILLGHSGGSMISGIILDRHPGLADGAVLMSWACNTRQWRQWRINSAGKRKQWLRSLSAHDHIARVKARIKDLDYPDGIQAIHHGPRKPARYDTRRQLMLKYANAVTYQQYGNRHCLVPLQPHP